MTTPARFTFGFEQHRPDGKVWRVTQGGRSRFSRHVLLSVPVWTVYKGPQARQPRAYLQGVGVVSGNSSRLRITAA